MPANFNPSDYGPAIATLLKEAPTNALGPGRPRTAARQALAALEPATIVTPAALVDREMAQACLAGLWLRFDFVEQAHAIAQDLETPEGSYWHGILHRREPDFANAKYWFRHVGRHPVFEPLALAARKLIEQAGNPAVAKDLSTQKIWDAARFVDLCQSAVDGDATLRPLCEQIQQREWELLFAHCWRHAAGRV